MGSIAFNHAIDSLFTHITQAIKQKLVGECCHCTGRENNLKSLLFRISLRTCFDGFFEATIIYARTAAFQLKRQPRQIRAIKAFFNWLIVAAWYKNPICRLYQITQSLFTLVWHKHFSTPVSKERRKRKSMFSREPQQTGLNPLRSIIDTASPACFFLSVFACQLGSNSLVVACSLIIFH